MMQKGISAVVCGLSNAGKSTILNKLIGLDLFIVSPRLQSTRNNIESTIISNETQIVLTDTPGIAKHKSIISNKIQKTVKRSVVDAESIVFVLDALYGFNEKTINAFNQCSQNAKQKLIVINKIDLINDEKLQALISTAWEYNPDEVLAISAKNNVGIDALRMYFEHNSNEKVWTKSDSIIDKKDYGIVSADITREYIMNKIDGEIPYQLHVHTVRIEVGKPYVIYQVVYVVKKNHAAIIIGKGGENLKKLARLSARRLSKIMKEPVKVMLSVEVDSRWIQKTIALSSINIDELNQN